MTLMRRRWSFGRTGRRAIVRRRVRSRRARCSISGGLGAGLGGWSINYDQLTVLEQVVGAVPAGDRAPFREDWRPRIGARAGTLERLLDGPFFDKPILLVVGDLERALVSPAPGRMLTPVRDSYGWRVFKSDKPCQCRWRVFGLRDHSKRQLGRQKSRLSAKHIRGFPERIIRKMRVALGCHWVGVPE